ncbi:MAG: HlyD family secretion protein [Terriglobia bacterium]
MKLKILFVFALIGIVASGVAVRSFSREHPSPPPLHRPSSDPYAHGIYADGIVESEQSSGENIDVFPDVSGTVKAVYVREGQHIRRGAPLFLIDDSVQRAATEQLLAQAQAADRLLEELKAEPRKQNLAIAAAQVEAAEATLQGAERTLAYQEATYKAGISTKQAFDSASDAAASAKANVDVAKRQYTLTRAGAWSYDIRNEEAQHAALEASYRSSLALLARYTLRAPADGVVLSINTVAGSYVSSQGAYDPYTQSSGPVMVIGTPQSVLEVRCYVDEILIPRLPPSHKMQARMVIRGTDITIPLQYLRIQPYVSPKIELSDERPERVDVRDLPVIFGFDKPKGVTLYPGELVGVFIGRKG